MFGASKCLSRILGHFLRACVKAGVWGGMGVPVRGPKDPPMSSMGRLAHESHGRPGRAVRGFPRVPRAGCPWDSWAGRPCYVVHKRGQTLVYRSASRLSNLSGPLSPAQCATCFLPGKQSPHGHSGRRKGRGESRISVKVVEKPPTRGDTGVRRPRTVLGVRRAGNPGWYRAQEPGCP